MTSLSVVICVCNEERNIARCLKSVESVADEVIVVDSGSTDRTEEICRSFEKVQWHKTQWKGFGPTKNWANQKATCDYILSLDADEELSEELQSEIRQLKNSGRLNGAYEFNRLTNYCGHWIHHSEWFPDWCLRVFPRKQGEWDERQVHEQLHLPSGLARHRLTHLVHHYSYYQLSDHIERINRYSELGAQDVLNSGKTSLFASAIFNGGFRFFRIFILKRGFLDGRHGFLIAVISGFAVFLKYAKAWQKSRLESPPRSN